MLTPSEFIAFAQSMQDREWFTKTGKPFSYEVRNSGIYLLPRSAKERNISNAEIVKFCQIFNDTKSETMTHYQELFNKSYLLAIMDKYDPGLIEPRLPEEVGTEKLIKEGSTKQITINTYERSPTAKKKCIEVHGTSCCICSFDFAAVYGDFAAGFIHVHHLNPLAVSGGEHAVDPVNDLRPVCPNCHAVVHLRGGCLSIDEVKELIRNAA